MDITCDEAKHLTQSRTERRIHMTDALGCGLKKEEGEDSAGPATMETAADMT